MASLYAPGRWRDPSSESHVIICLRGSVRSLWSAMVVLVGVTFSMLGAAMVTMPREPGVTQPTYVSGLVIGAVCVVLRLPFVWGGARMGILRDGQCLRVRQLFGRARTLCFEDITGFIIDEAEHHTLPLMQIQPGIVLAGGTRMEVSALATYRVIPGSTRRVQTAVRRMAEWTGRPLL